MASFKCKNGHETAEDLNESGFCRSCLCMTCKIGDSERSIRCFTCKKWNHYKCTLLNPWYILNYVETGSQYKCTSCTKDRVVKILADKNKTQEEIQSLINELEEYLSNDTTLTSPPSPSQTPLPQPANSRASPNPPQTQASRVHPPTPIPPSLSLPQPTTDRSLLPLPHTPRQNPPSIPTLINESRANASQNSFETRSDTTTSTSSTNSLDNTIVEPNRQPAAEGVFVEENGDEPPICKYYKKGYCNSRETCTYSHPKLCKFWARNPINGCHYSSEECRFYHPRQCFEYENRKKCEKESCRYFHRKNALHDAPWPVEGYGPRQTYTNQRTPTYPSRSAPTHEHSPSTFNSSPHVFPTPDVNNEREFPTLPGRRHYVRRNSRAQRAQHYIQNDDVPRSHQTLQSMNASSYTTNFSQEHSPANPQDSNGAEISGFPGELIMNQTATQGIPTHLNTNTQPPNPMQQQSQPQIPIRTTQNTPVQGPFLPPIIIQEVWKNQQEIWKILRPWMPINGI